MLHVCLIPQTLCQKMLQNRTTPLYEHRLYIAVIELIQQLPDEISVFVHFHELNTRTASNAVTATIAKHQGWHTPVKQGKGLRQSTLRVYYNTKRVRAIHKACCE